MNSSERIKLSIFKARLHVDALPDESHRRPKPDGMFLNNMLFQSTRTSLVIIRCIAGEIVFARTVASVQLHFLRIDLIENNTGTFFEQIGIV